MFNALHPTASPNQFAISYEFFPPKTPEMETQLWQTINRLAALKPHFVSVTYGAGGTTRERTHSIVARIVRETEMKPAAHLTCVSAAREDDRRDPARLLGRRRSPYRGAARRSADRRRVEI